MIVEMSKQHDATPSPLAGRAGVGAPAGCYDPSNSNASRRPAP